jgi:hypothetical protein
LLQFMPGQGLQRMVIAAGAEESEATARVLKRYGIREPSRLAATTNAPGGRQSP